MVAPYSGDMLAIVARSVSDKLAAPSPWYSTNLPTTLALRSISVMVNTRSVAVTPSRRLPEHCAFRLDAADAPAYDAQPVDHCGVRVGANQRVRIEHAILLLNTFG